ncbi:NUDIX hydrolase [Phenylobacterium sp.]|uniref:NUDIX hydrolase n=1 Tax=Phenylobacterium sp. TaxID=1871053 RepID=UPI00289C486E|nr:NUDIX hydrolase [Phenylobacterium sp.]
MSQKPAWLTEHGKPWGRGESKVAYENPWITVTEHAAIAPTGSPAFYGVVGFKNYALAVLPIEDDGSVVLVGQHRFPFADYSWEIPEGGGPKHEDPLLGAQRELAEETGLAAADWREILRVQLSNSVTDELAIGYLATGLHPAVDTRHADDTEDIAMVRAPFRQALEAASAGHIRDALTVAMLLRAYHMAREGLLSAPLARAMLG